MKRMHILAALLLLATTVSASPVAQQSPVVATLTLPYATVLPGVPFDMTITLKNVSNRSVCVGMIAALSVKLPDGTTFAPKDSVTINPDQLGAPDTWLELASGETVQRAIPWFQPTQNWSHRTAYTGPGIYDISLELVARSGDDLPQNYIGPVRTTSARLERAVAPGEDEDLWHKMLAVSDGEWSDDGFTRLKSGVELAKEIVQIHPASNYYPYALLFKNRITPGKDAIAPLLEAADRFQASPAYPYLLKHAAQSALAEAMDADWKNRDPKAAEDYYRRAEDLFQRALKTSSLAVRADAQHGKEAAAVSGQKIRAVQKE